MMMKIVIVVILSQIVQNINRNIERSSFLQIENTMNKDNTDVNDIEYLVVGQNEIGNTINGLEELIESRTKQNI